MYRAGADGMASPVFGRTTFSSLSWQRSPALNEHIIALNIICIPYNGKFSYGTYISYMLHPLYENKNYENLNVKFLSMHDL